MTTKGSRGSNLSGGEALTLFASAARTVGAAVLGTAIDLGGERKRIVAVLDITASGVDIGDTLDVYIDWSLDNTIWYNAVHFTQQAGTGAAAREFAVLDPSNPPATVTVVTADQASGVVAPSVFGRYIRGRYTVVEGAGGGVASHTFSLKAYAQ